MALFGALVGAGTSILGGLGTGMLNHHYAKKDANDAWAREKAMWQMNNEYNTPANQMKRLEAAGLNPNLAYGNGTVANTSSGGGAPKANTPAVQTPNIMESIGGFQQIMDNHDLTQARIKNIEADTKYTTSNERYLVGSKTDNTNTSTDSMIANLQRTVQETQQSAEKYNNWTGEQRPWENEYTKQKALAAQLDNNLRRLKIDDFPESVKREVERISIDYIRALSSQRSSYTGEKSQSESQRHNQAIEALQKQGLSLQEAKMWIDGISNAIGTGIKYTTPVPSNFVPRGTRN